MKPLPQVLLFDRLRKIRKILLCSNAYVWLTYKASKCLLTMKSDLNWNQRMTNLWNEKTTRESNLVTDKENSLLQGYC